MNVEAPWVWAGGLEEPVSECRRRLQPARPRRAESGSLDGSLTDGLAEALDGCHYWLVVKEIMGRRGIGIANEPGLFSKKSVTFSRLEVRIG